MDSDGDYSSPVRGSKVVPDKPTIAAALKSTVQKWFKKDPELVTVGAARAHVEKELGLESGFLKKDGYWCKEAKTIVKDEFTTLSEAVEEEEREPTPKKKPAARKPAAKKAAAKPPPKKAAAKKSKPTDEDAGIEGEAEEEAPKKAPAKRGRPSTKKAKPTNDKDEDAIIEVEESPKKAPAKRGRPAATAKKPVPKPSQEEPIVGEGEDSDVPAEPSAPIPAPALGPAVAVTPDSESELSDIPDELLKNQTKRSQPSIDVPTKGSTSKKSQKKAAAEDEEGEGDAAAAPPAAPGSDSELSEIPNEPLKTKNGKRSLVIKADSPKKKVKVSAKAKAAPKEKVSTKAKAAPKEEANEGPGNDLENILKDRPVTSDADARSDSEMSVVLDPTPQKGRSSNTTKVPAPKKTKSPKASTARKPRAKKADSKPISNLDPEQEQIKSLKGWLLKCGIRRIWARELAKFDTPRAQIAHLRGLLTEIGMTGRYSADKAKKIKEERELRAEVEAVQEGAGVWGMEGKKEEEEVGRRRRSAGRRGRAVVEDEDDDEEVVEKQERIIRGREDLAFLDGQSESE